MRAASKGSVKGCVSKDNFFLQFLFFTFSILNRDSSF